MNKQQTKILITGLLVLILFLSSYLYYIEISKTSDILLCSPGSAFDCQKVSQTEYSKTFGISTALIGIAVSIFFLLVFNFIEINKRNFYIILFGLLISTFYAIRFLFLQFFVIKTICPFCFIIDISFIIILLLYFFGFRNS